MKPFAPSRLSLKAACFAALFIAALPLSAVHAAEPGKDLAAKLQPFVDDHVLAGAVTLVANKDKVLDLSAVGYEDVAAKKPMATDALFWIASMSKPITATALMMLVDEGKVNVDDPVEKYLPEFHGQMLAVEKNADHVLLKKPSHPITVKNVLSHTSGLPFASPIEKPTLDLLPLSARVRSYAMESLDFDPDSDYRYANAGINTAGRIIEVVSGMAYEDFLEQRIFKPLGMKDTTFWPNDEQLTRLAKSYHGNKDKSDIEETPVSQLKYPLNDHVNRQPMPAGGLFSTATDIGRFCQMILNGGEFEGKRYLSEESIKKMTSRETPENLKQSYGFGWSANGASFGHGGAYSTNMNIDTKTGLITVFMVQNAGWRNDEGKKIQGVFTKAAAEAFGK